MIIAAEARRMAGVTLVQREHSVGELWTGASPAMRLRVARVPGVGGRASYWFAVCRGASGTRAGETIAEARGATGQECGDALEAAWRAILAGRAGDVPRELWLGVIAVAAGLLGWLVLRPQRSPSRQRSGHRPAQRIDWSEVDDAEPGEPVAPRRQVAA